MRVLRGNWKALLVLVLLAFGGQGVSSSVCFDEAFLTVLSGPGGKVITTTVQSPDQNPWEGWVTMTVTVNGEDYTFSYEVSVPAGGTRTHRLVFSSPPTVINHRACDEPDGMTESPEPIAIVASQE